MPRRNRRVYLLMGIDRLEPYSECRDIVVTARLYNLDSPTPMTPVFKIDPYPEDIDHVSDCIRNAVNASNQFLGSKINNVRVFPGQAFSSGVFISHSLRNSGDWTEKTSDSNRKTQWFYRDYTTAKLSVKCAILKEMPYGFRLASKSRTSGQYYFDSTDFDSTLSCLIREVGIESLCSKTVTTLQLVKNKLRGTFENCEKTSATNAGDLALFEEDTCMNSGGRMIARESGELKKCRSFDFNSGYHNILLTKKFSTVRMFHMSKMFPSFLGIRDVMFSESKRDHYLNLLKNFKDSCGLQLRVIFRAQDVAIKPDGSPLHVKFSPYLNGPECKNYVDCEGGLAAAPNTKRYCLFLEEVIQLFDNYIMRDNVFVEEIYVSKTVLLPRKVREAAWMAFVEAQSYKNEMTELRLEQKATTDPRKKASLGRRIRSLGSLCDFKKLERNHYPGYFEYHYHRIKNYQQDYLKQLSEGKKPVYNKKLLCYLGYRAQKEGYLPCPLIGSEITFEGRQLHRRLEKFFTDRGFNVFYGNTDSVYVEEAPGIEKAMYEWNVMIAKEFQEATRDLSIHENIKYYQLPGTLKQEFSGYVIHTGPNRMIKADENYRINGCSFSGYNPNDILRSIGGMDIRELHRGSVIKNVGHVDSEGIVTVGDLVL